MFIDNMICVICPVPLIKVLLHPVRLITAHLEDSTAQRILDETGNFVLSVEGDFIYDDP